MSIQEILELGAHVAVEVPGTGTWVAMTGHRGRIVQVTGKSLAEVEYRIAQYMLSVLATGLIIAGLAGQAAMGCGCDGCRQAISKQAH